MGRPLLRQVRKITLSFVGGIIWYLLITLKTLTISEIDKWSPAIHKTKASHALVRMEPTDNKWDKQITSLLSDHVANLVFDRIDLLKIRDSIDSLEWALRPVI